MQALTSARHLNILYALLAIVYVSGLFIPLMENDSAQHATMAMRMALENDYAHLYKGFNDYLDKPHMHFWLAALSFEVFGIHHWSYRIPALLFTIIGAISCFGLAKDFYGNKYAGHAAALIFLSAQAIILANHDVRTDAVLTGATILSIWQLSRYLRTGGVIALVIGATAMGLAFSTKGLLGVFFIGSALLCDMIYHKSWSRLWSWKALIGVMVFFLTCLPMLLAYYIQFDLHPEKMIEGKTGVSGVRFILWDQSFNRLTGTGFEGNNTDHFFFFHTLLWAFLPWCLIAYVAIFDRTRQAIVLRLKETPGFEFMTIGAFWLIMLVINTSKSKLPHYMNSLFPILSVLLGGYLWQLIEAQRIRRAGNLLIVQYVVTAICLLALAVILFWVFPAHSILLWLGYVLGLGVLIVVLLLKMKPGWKIVALSVCLSFFVNFVLNTTFYPNLLKYQAGNQMAALMQEEGISADDTYLLKENFSWTLSFYNKQLIKVAELDDLKDLEGKWLFVYDRDLEAVESRMQIADRHQMPHYRITMLSLPFLNPATREKELKQAYLVKLKR